MRNLNKMRGRIIYCLESQKEKVAAQTRRIKEMQKHKTESPSFEKWGLAKSIEDQFWPWSLLTTEVFLKKDPLY